MVRVLALLPLALAAPRQQPKDAPAPKPPGAAAESVEDGKRALAQDRARAQRHFLRALELEPANAAALRELVLASDDDDAAWLWGYALADAVADEAGAVKLDSAARTRLKSDAPFRALPLARAEAVRELARAAARLGPDDPPSVARWLREVAREVARRQPALERKHGKDLDAAAQRCAPKHDAVIAALGSAIDASMARMRPDDALAAARCLHGLAGQASFMDLASPAPDLKASGSAAAKGILRARAALQSKEGAPKSIAELEAMSPEERDVFNAEHADAARPGVAHSPTGLYRIETTCGHATLLATAKRVEDHHARLVRWFGKDPFAGRPGLVRVVPEASDLESEGSPFWWAGGFQSGDATHVRFAHGTGSRLGRVITHELTHRFDSALHPGLPAWAAEGRAVWTGGAYGPDEQESFTEWHASFGAVSEAYRAGYGGVEKLTKLVNGTIDDYRDNYSAGHALWIFLWSWETAEKRLYRARFDRFARGAPPGQGLAEWFASCFADGKEGRPAGMEAFAAAFAEFLKGFWWETRAPWLGRYAANVPSQAADPWIYDAPTWSAVRDRAEPYFGQDHAAEAGRILARVGNPVAATAAFEWALEVDEIEAGAARALARLHEEAGRADAAWILRSRLHRAWPAREPEPPAPTTAKTLGALSKTRSLLSAYADAVGAHRAAGRAGAAAALAADHDRVAALIGSKALPAAPPPVDASSRPAPRWHPGCEPPVAVGAAGFVEDRLKDFEEYRAAGLWHATPGGDLVLGRSAGTLQTGQERGTAQVETFARGREWMTGPFSVRARVRFLTTYASGAAVIGYRRRDRQLRLTYGAGDFLYSTDKKSESDAHALHLGLGDLRERESSRAIGGAITRDVPFDKDRTSFELEVLVDGPSAHLFVNGKHLGSHRAASAIPVEGFVGFATDYGAIAVEGATVQRHRRAAGSDRCACRAWPAPLDVSVASDSPWELVVGQGTRGVPTGDRGTALLWIEALPAPDEEDPSSPAREVADSVERLVERLGSAGFESMTVAVAIPSGAPPDVEKAASEALAARKAAGAVVLRHAPHRGLEAYVAERSDTRDAATPWLLLVDPDGCVRARDLYRRSSGFSNGFRHWARVLRGR